MSKYSSIVSATDMGTYEDFIELFKEGDQYKKDVTGRTLLQTALLNSKPEEKYKIVNFLINKGSDVTIVDKDGSTLFDFLFAYGRTDIVKTTMLCKTLLEKGADITAIYKPHKTTMIKYIFNYHTVPEIEMIPLYDLIFSQEGLQLLKKDKWGLTVLEFAKRAKREIGIKYIEDYIKRYNLKEED